MSIISNLTVYCYFLAQAPYAGSKKIFGLLIVIPFVILLSGAIIYANKTLNPDRELGGRIDLGYALEYAKQYSYGVDGYGYSYGRIATTLRVIEILRESGVSQILLGVGPGATTPSFLGSKKEREIFERQYDSFKIAYGLTTMNRIALEYGLAGVVIFIAMLIGLTRMCLKLYRVEREPYWKAFAAGSVWFSFSMVFFAFTYHWTAFWGDTMPPLYFYAMAVVYTRYNHRNLQTSVVIGNSIVKQARHPVTV